MQQILNVDITFLIVSTVTLAVSNKIGKMIPSLLSIRTNLIRLKITEIIPIFISITTQNLKRNKHCHF